MQGEWFLSPSVLMCSATNASLFVHLSVPSVQVSRKKKHENSFLRTVHKVVNNRINSAHSYAIFAESTIFSMQIGTTTPM